MNAQIKVDQFCGLSTSPAWQAWLYRFSADLYQELAAHLRTSKGCGANRDKMMELMTRINATPQGSDKLLEFLRGSFPHVVEQAAPQAAVPQVVSAPTPARVPFERYDPRLLTFPRRQMFEGQDQSELTRRVHAFLADKVRSDWVIVGDKAYVEYVPSEHARVAGSVPEKNWLVTKWKREHQR